jgi:hypothetical protein
MGLQKYKRMRCVVFGLVRLCLCKIFARRVYKNTNARNDMTMRFFFGFVLSQGDMQLKHSTTCDRCVRDSHM